MRSEEAGKDAKATMTERKKMKQTRRRVLRQCLIFQVNNVVVSLCWMSLLSVFTLLAVPTQGWDSDVRLYGVDYTLRIGAGSAVPSERCKSLEQVSADLQQLQLLTDRIRILSLTDCNSGDILFNATQEMSEPMGLWLGLWVGSNGTNFVEERQELLQLLQTRNFSNVEGIHVSSEAIYRGDVKATQAIDFRNTIRDDLAASEWPNIPVVVDDHLDTLLTVNQLALLDDNVVQFNLFPFWEPAMTNINTAADYMEQRINELLPISGNRQIVIGATGWADQGTDPNANPANGPSMQKWLRDFVCLANEKNWAYFWFQAYDSNWQVAQLNDQDTVEAHFGLFDENGVLKPYFQGEQNFNIDCSQPRVDIASPQNATFAPVPTAPPTNDAECIPLGSSCEIGGTPCCGGSPEFFCLTLPGTTDGPKCIRKTTSNPQRNKGDYKSRIFDEDILRCPPTRSRCNRRKVQRNGSSRTPSIRGVKLEASALHE